MPLDPDKKVAVIGGGPAGLMAAEVLANAGVAVTVFDHKPSPGRKFLLAGRGGLNLTHSEPLEPFLKRYGEAAGSLTPAIEAFPPDALRAWCEGLGQPVFTGTSGRIFPKSFKATPLLRAWLARLEGLGVSFRFHHRWTGWDIHDRPVFDHQGERVAVDTGATILALGGASWPRLGSDGGWTAILEKQDIAVAPLRPANCGFTVGWSAPFAEKFAGAPVKPVRLSFAWRSLQGEFVITQSGLEGSAIYALSSLLRPEIESKGKAILTLDLRPGLSQVELAKRLSTPRGRESFSNYLRKAAGLSPVAIGLLRETAGPGAQNALPDKLAALIKAADVFLLSPAPIDRAISSAGGIAFDELDPYLMLNKRPGTFAAGEMLDWEAPTGGYLLQASFSTGVRAAQGALFWLNRWEPKPRDSI
jgi:uncharacterized flavoprotein (TIGR03862 family)